MNNTMTDRINIATINDDSLLGIGENLNRTPHAALMIGHSCRFFNHQLILAARPERAFNQSLGFPYSFDKSGCQNRFIGHIEKLEFY
jgi:hypothetical protein